MKSFEKQAIGKLDVGPINVNKLKELKATILELTKGRKASVAEIIYQANVSSKFVLYCVHSGALSEFGFDHLTQTFFRKLRLVHG